MRIPLFLRLLLSSLLPALLLFGGFAWVGHYLAARALERELGERLIAVARLFATQLDPESLALLEPGDENTRTYRNLRHRLEAARTAGDVARVYVVDATGATVGDTQPGRAIGSHDYRLDADQRERQLALHGVPQASVLFRGNDGLYYKSGYAAVGGQPAKYLVGVDGAATLFDELGDLRKALTFAGGFTALVVLLIALVVARRVTARLEGVGEAAARIGRGDLRTPVTKSGATTTASSDEIDVVAATLEAMRQQVGERDERMQMMLAGIAHEVRNPLAGMSLYAGLLREDLAENPELALQLGHAQKIERELAHLQEIVTSFLEYARRPKPELQPADLAQLVSEVVELEGPTAERLTVALTMTTAKSAPARVALDNVQLRRALLNLVRNALQATQGRANAAVELVVAPDADDARFVTVSIGDNGPGIPADQLEQIWTPFYTTKQQGTGLGLPFVREIVRDHGGTITVDSKLDHGTTFRIRLPKISAQE